MDDVQNLDRSLFSPGSFHGWHDESCDESAVPFDWEPPDLFAEVSFHDAFAGIDQLFQGSGVTAVLQDAVPRVLDPQKCEPSWKHSVLETDVKRSRRELEKLPWDWRAPLSDLLTSGMKLS